MACKPAYLGLAIKIIQFVNAAVLVMFSLYMWITHHYTIVEYAISVLYILFAFVIVVEQFKKKVSLFERLFEYVRYMQRYIGRTIYYCAFALLSLGRETLRIVVSTYFMLIAIIYLILHFVFKATEEKWEDEGYDQLEQEESPGNNEEKNDAPQPAE
jgi:intracellular septation protein A